MRLGLYMIGTLLVAASTASAQSPFVYKPIDTDKLILAPTNTVAATTGNTTQTTIKTIGSTISGAIENNGFVRTFNNIFGRRAAPAAYQPGFSALPTYDSFASTRYQNRFKATLPMASTFGSTPNVPIPQGPNSIR